MSSLYKEEYSMIACAWKLLLAHISFVSISKSKCYEQKNLLNRDIIWRSYATTSSWFNVPPYVWTVTVSILNLNREIDRPESMIDRFDGKNATADKILDGYSLILSFSQCKYHLIPNLILFGKEKVPWLGSLERRSFLPCCLYFLGDWTFLWLWLYIQIWLHHSILLSQPQLVDKSSSLPSISIFPAMLYFLILRWCGGTESDIQWYRYIWLSVVLLSILLFYSIFLYCIEEFLRDHPNSIFLVTSDDVKWCKEHLKHDKVVFPELRSDHDLMVTDFVLMTYVFDLYFYQVGS